MDTATKSVEPRKLSADELANEQSWHWFLNHLPAWQWHRLSRYEADAHALWAGGILAEDEIAKALEDDKIQEVINAALFPDLKGKSRKAEVTPDNAEDKLLNIIDS